MIPVASVQRASITAEFALVFACSQCRARADARVRATGKGEATGTPIASGLPELAEMRAAVDLPNEARELLDLARCPTCGRRGARAIRSWWLVNIVQAAFVLAILVGVPALLFRLVGGMRIGEELALLLLVMPYLVVRFFVRLWQVDRRVVFEA